MKTKTLTIIFVILILVAALTLTAFARGRGSNQLKIQLDSNSFKKIEPAIKNLYDSLKNLVNKEVSAGLISSYYAQSIISNLDAAYSQINKTKIIYLPFFSGMGFRGPKGMGPFNMQGPQNNQQPAGQGNPPAGAPGYGQSFGQGNFGLNQNQLSAEQMQALKNIIPDVMKVIDAETNFGKALKDAGIITELQLSTYLSRLDQVKQNVNQFPMIHYGIMQFLMIAGYTINN